MNVTVCVRVRSSKYDVVQDENQLKVFKLLVKDVPNNIVSEFKTRTSEEIMNLKVILIALVNCDIK